MIEELTEAQKAKMPEYVKKWTAIGLATGRANLSETKIGLKKAYEVAGLEAPKAVIVADSPISADVIYKILKEGNVKLLEDSNSGEFIETIASSIEDSARNSICRALGHSVTDKAWNTVLNKIKKSEHKALNTTIYGNHDADFLSFYDYIGTELGIEKCKDLEGLNIIAKNAGWVVVMKEIAIVQHKPKTIKLEDGTPHSISGPAIEYYDGYKVYCYRGEIFPGEWIEEGLTAKEALSQENTELRRIACEIVGWNEVAKELGAKTIDKHPDPMVGELIEVNLPDSGPEKFLRVMCGTGREFSLMVDNNVQTALGAWNWLHSFPLDRPYHLEVRT